MDLKKSEKLAVAQQELEDKKKEIQKEKSKMLVQVKEDIKMQKEF